MHGHYKAQAAFFVVYIREAHPSDAWQMPVNIKDDVVHASPADAEERSKLAQVCVSRLAIKLPAVVDDFDNSTDTAYTGWPDRLYVIGPDGRVAYKSKPGPFGFKPAELEAALKAVLPASKAQM